MRRITLREFVTTSVAGITAREAIALARAIPELRVSPSVIVPDGFDLTPGSYVGAVWMPGLEVQILPKIELNRLLFLVSYSVDPSAWREDLQTFTGVGSVVEAIVPAFVRLTSRAIRRGLLHGYRPVSDSLQTVRGTILFADQVNRRLGLAPPIEVQFDEFAADIDENRLLKAAVHRLLRLRVKSEAVLRSLRRMRTVFDQVSAVEYDPRSLPQPTFTRLNRHYEPAVTLARAILRNTSFDLGEGSSSGTSFLLDMNDVFETFLYEALREALGESSTTFRHGSAGLTLDFADRVRLEPDLSWWSNGQCEFVGDAKYKSLGGESINHADIYQLLAYATAARVKHGLLVYAAGSTQPMVHRVRHADIDLEVQSLNLAGPPAQILTEIARIATSIRSRATLSSLREKTV